jgi:hypothetical protein
MNPESCEEHTTARRAAAASSPIRARGLEKAHYVAAFSSSLYLAGSALVRCPQNNAVRMGLRDSLTR